MPLMSLRTQMGLALLASLRLLTGPALLPRQLTLHLQRLRSATLGQVLPPRQVTIGALCMAAPAATSSGGFRSSLRCPHLARQS